MAPNRIGSEAVILKGLEPGERIVVEGVQKLREGAPVQPKTADEVAKSVAALAPPAEAAHAKQGETKPAKE